MNERSFQQRIHQLLRTADPDAISKELAQLPPQKLLKPLLAGICSADEQLRWQAIRAMGQTVAALADQDLEAARVVMRRFMWSLNDESGGIGWGVPEAMGEVLAAHPRLAEEYTHILVAYMREDGFYLEYAPLQRGLMWGLGRLAAVRPELLQARNASSYLLPYLAAPDPAVRGLAARALGYLAARESIPQLTELLTDPAPVRFFADDRLETASVGALAAQALTRLAGAA